MGQLHATRVLSGCVYSRYIIQRRAETSGERLHRLECQRERQRERVAAETPNERQSRLERKRVHWREALG